MFRLWARLYKDNHIIKDTVITNDNPNLRRTQKIFQAIDDICYQFDLSKPIWFDSNTIEFQRHSKVRFRKDNFIEPISFDFLELQIIEED